jgi:hypothetical protein
VEAGNIEGAMAWSAKLDGVDGSAKDGTSNTLMLAEMDAFKFMPATEDEVLVAFEFGDKDHDVLAWSPPTSPGPNAGAYGFFLRNQPVPADYNADWDGLGDMTALGEDANKPSLIVKLDIGGPSGSVLE